MSRSGYSDELDPFEHGRWRAAVRKAIRGPRGQKLLRETLAALDAMPVKELTTYVFVTDDGKFCTLGVVGDARKIDI